PAREASPARERPAAVERPGRAGRGEERDEARGIRVGAGPAYQPLHDRGVDREADPAADAEQRQFAPQRAVHHAASANSAAIDAASGLRTMPRSVTIASTS